MKTTNISNDSKLDKLADYLLCAAQEYWEEYQKQVGSDAVVWVKNNDTGQFICYTRGEHATTLIDTISELI